MPCSGLTDYHVHTPLCRHAEGWPLEMAARAVELGLAELGFADHNPMPVLFDDWRMLREELPQYLEQVEWARRQFPRLPIRLGLEMDFLEGCEPWWEELPHYLEQVGWARRQFPKLPIRLGLEMDFLDGCEPWWEQLRSAAPWDFWIGSVHYLADGMEVDNPKYLSRYRETDPGDMWAAYWERYEECIRSGWFDFVAHPDLPKKFGFLPGGDLRRFYEPSIQALVDTGLAYEINTAGLRKDCRELYPAHQFAALAREAGVPVLINSDAHSVGELGAGYAEAVALLREVGYTEVVRYEGRRRVSVPLPVPASVGGAR